MSDIKNYLRECQYQMKGINIKEFRETLEHNHELEFKYNERTYVIQSIEEDKKYWLVAYLCDNASNGDNLEYLVKEESFLRYGVEKDVVDKVLNAKCFEGKSFFEIYQDIEIIFWA